MTAGASKSRLRQWLPYEILVPVAVLMALAPFATQPHLLEKLGMLFAGTLARPIDIFDLVLHGTPTVLLAVRVGADIHARIRRRGNVTS